MGIFKALSNVVQSVGDVITKNAIVKPANVISNVIKPGSGTATLESFKSSAVGDVITKSAGIAGSALVVAVGTSKTGVSVAKSLIPKSTAGKVIAIASAPVVVGALSSSPKASTALVNAPSSLVNFGSNVGKVLENPTLSNVQQTIKENPLISGAVVTTGLIATGGAIKAVTNVLQTQAVRENTQAIKEQIPQTSQLIPPSISVIDKTGEFQIEKVGQTSETKPFETLQTTPQTPLTKEIRSSTARKKRRKSPINKAVLPNISQRVNVIVSNKASSDRISKRYLNAIALKN